MFKKQKEKLKSQYNAKKYELKQTARQKIANAVSITSKCPCKPLFYVLTGFYSILV